MNDPVFFGRDLFVEVKALGGRDAAVQISDHHRHGPCTEHLLGLLHAAGMIAPRVVANARWEAAA